MTLQEFRSQTESLPPETQLLILIDGDLEPTAILPRSQAPAAIQEDMPPGSLLIVSEFDLSIPYTTTPEA